MLLKGNSEVNPAIESEKTLLGGLLLDSKLFEEIVQKLSPSDFFYETHQKIFDAMCKVYQKRNMFDVAMISDEMEIDGDYLLEIANGCCSTINLKSHADIIREKSVQRQLIECSEEIEKDEMEKDFEGFHFVIKPIFNNDTINFLLLCTDKKSNKTSNAEINPHELKKFGMGYLFSLMLDLVLILKTHMNFENNRTEN